VTRVFKPESLLAEHVHPEVGRLVPEHVCKTFGVFPFDLHDGVLYVAAVDAEDAVAARVVSKITGRDVELVAYDEAQISEAVAEAFAGVDQSFGPELDAGDVEIGRMLLDLGLITANDLDQAAQEHATTGDPVGDILVANEIITQLTYVSVLAERSGLQRVDLDPAEVDLEVARLLPVQLARKLSAVPVAREGDVIFLASAQPLSPDELTLLAEHIGTDVHLLLATKFSLDQLIQLAHREEFGHLSANLLKIERPHESAHIVATTGQKTFLVLALLALIGSAVAWPMKTAIGFTAVCSAIYLAVSIYRFRLTYRALGKHFETDVTADQLDHVDEHLLPTYTILVPLYKEAGIVGRLVRDLNALDYPRTKLDVKLLCEEDDTDCIETIRSLDLPPHFHLVIVPDSQPKTKPKACNYGLLLAEGKYTVIYDAEDRPDPDQLKKAVVAFSLADDNIACIQGKLNYFNGRQNILTSWFANEYSMHYELILPAMGDDRAPIPLGGTSNHFITDLLRELGGWDPYNVTEDADLGIRLHREGYRTAIMDSTTLEEANSEVPNWIRQRSRWIKGYMQTYLVHMRNPVRLFRKLGPKGFLSFNLTVGGAFVHLINPLFWGLTTLYVLTRAHLIEQLFPGFVYYAAAGMLFVGNFVFVYLNVAGSLQRGQFELTRYALMSPIYWGMMAWAAWKGFIQLFTNPFYWEKTEHGLNEDHV
jgi:cellulose synthase/poly-beta-1,6-N-acetylglucosamine synthase-like glycosyltransferase